MSYKRARNHISAEYYRLQEAMEVFAMGQEKIEELAMECGAYYKIDRIVLIKKSIFQEFIESFKVEKSNF